MIKHKRLPVVLVLMAVFCASTVVWGGERYAVSASIVNIRQGPGTDYDVVWRVEKYYPVLVVEKRGDWYRFEDFEGDEGWIHNSLLDRTKTVVVNRDTCNVRQGPGTDHPIAFEAQGGVPFKVIGTRGDWVNIQHADGDTGWVYKPLVW